MPARRSQTAHESVRAAFKIDDAHTYIWQRFHWLVAWPCSRAEKEKGKFQAEIYELLNQIESSNKDRVSA